MKNQHWDHKYFPNPLQLLFELKRSRKNKFGTDKRNIFQVSRSSGNTHPPRFLPSIAWCKLKYELQIHVSETHLREQPEQRRIHQD